MQENTTNKTQKLSWNRFAPPETGNTTLARTLRPLWLEQRNMVIVNNTVKNESEV